jgi:hypothetical protein
MSKRLLNKNSPIGLDSIVQQDYYILSAWNCNPEPEYLAMTTATQTRSTTLTHGTCRLIPACALPLPQAIDAGEAMLTLYPTNGKPASYLVQRLADPDGGTVGFRLTRLAAYIVDRKVYDIDVTPGYGWQCDCPDAQYHGHACKHVRALRAALAHAGLVAAPPQRQGPVPPVCAFDDP